jgi:hemerythrin-like metal-binding protein
MNEREFEHYKMDILGMDESHWGLFQVLNSIAFTLTSLEMHELASKLNQMWDDHHLEEEALMDDLGYPYTTTHKKAHILITRQFHEFKSRLDNDHKYTNNYFKRDVEDLLRDHIDYMDSQYAAWAKKVNYLDK